MFAGVALFVGIVHHRQHVLDAGRPTHPGVRPAPRRRGHPPPNLRAVLGGGGRHRPRRLRTGDRSRHRRGRAPSRPSRAHGADIGYRVRGHSRPASGHQRLVGVGRTVISAACPRIERVGSAPDPPCVAMRESWLAASEARDLGPGCARHWAPSCSGSQSLATDVSWPLAAVGVHGSGPWDAGGGAAAPQPIVRVVRGRVVAIRGWWPRLRPRNACVFHGVRPPRPSR